ncbi:hypothetical protein QTP86_002748 [Hemibagrus guttatus]|nr:hypothetical protein QTP86_002748 [Hemibagrus guttatus]
MPPRLFPASSSVFRGFASDSDQDKAVSKDDEDEDFLHTVLKNHTAHACDGETLTIRCPSKTSVVVLSAFYGRRIPSQHLCPNANANVTEESTECMSTIAIQKVVSECQDRRACQIPVASPVFGQDPCPETSKYLLVSYKCRPECLSPSALRKVSRKCHGRINCTVMASVQSFGDPCFPGTSKHLRVTFTCVPRYLLEDMGRGGADPFRISDYTHGLPETVALYFVSGICAGLVFLLCLFGVKSTLVRDVKDLVSDIEDEIKTARRSRRGLINDDDISLDSSFPHLTHPYRGADMFSPEMVMTVVMEEKRDEDRDKAEVPNGDIWPHCNFSPYAIHKTKLSSA